jgi:hypothetical protein
MQHASMIFPIMRRTFSMQMCTIRLSHRITTKPDLHANILFPHMLISMQESLHVTNAKENK